MNNQHSIIRYASLTILILLAGIFLAGCKNSAKNTAEEMIEQAHERETGQKMDINLGENTATITNEMGTTQYSSEIKTWPKEIPADVPQFNYGKLDGGLETQQNEGMGWTLSYKNVPQEALKDYDKQLKSRGFQTNVVIINDQGGSVMGTKGKISVTFMGGEEGGVLSIYREKE